MTQIILASKSNRGRCIGFGRLATEKVDQTFNRHNRDGNV